MHRNHHLARQSLGDRAIRNMQHIGIPVIIIHDRKHRLLGRWRGHLGIGRTGFSIHHQTLIIYLEPRLAAGRKPLRSFNNCATQHRGPSAIRRRTIICRLGIIFLIITRMFAFPKFYCIETFLDRSGDSQRLFGVVQRLIIGTILHALF